jgi:Novel STAND NTPase 2
MPLLNPFLYGKPVPPARFVGRRDAVRTLFSRLYNGESTAIVGEPHIGKSSLLRYATDDEVRSQWLEEAAPNYFFTDIDCHMLPRNFTSADFWRQALTALSLVVPDEPVVRQWQVVVDNQFGSFTLDSLFQLLARSRRRVVLVIDEFDSLLNHPNFNAEFFGALRSMATRTDSLAVITASRLSVAAMNRLSHELNPLGSPFFNNITEVRLLPLSPDESRGLIEMTLADTGVAFTDEDYTFVHDLSSRHPFLLQIAAAGLFDAAVDGKAGEARYHAGGRFFHDCAAAYFDEFWRHLSPTGQIAMMILALGEMKGRVDGREFNTDDLGRIEWYGPELLHLQDLGMVERVDQRIDIAGLTLWQGARWRVASRGFAWWAAGNVIAGTRDTVVFDQWLRDKEYQGLLTREQADSVRSMLNSIPKSVVSGVAQMVKSLLGEMVKGWTGFNPMTRNP